MTRHLLILLGFFLAWVLNANSVHKKDAETSKKLKIVTTISALASLAREVGGERVEVHSLTTASEDPHSVRPLPTFKKLVGEADLFLQVGRSLELWVPKVIESSGNARLISGQALISVSEGISALEIPNILTRQKGDIHPHGNPHLWLSPTAGLKIAENIKNALVKIDPTHANTYENNFKNFKNKLSISMFGPELVKKAHNDDFLWRLHNGKKIKEYSSQHKISLGGWLKQALEINYSFLTYHTVFSYFAQDFNLKIAGQIEEKSGVEPTARYIKTLVEKSKIQNINHIIAASYYKSHKTLIDRIAQQIKGKALLVDVDSAKNQSYSDFISKLLTELVKFK